ncbi:MAG: hypothetical protein ACXWIO_04650 [Croceibacterium sp.]
MSVRAGGRGANFPVTCRARGHNIDGRLYDLTREGCLLDLGNGLIVAGYHVAIRFASGVRLQGRVTLLHGRIARVEFEQALHLAIFDHLANGDGLKPAPVERSFNRSQRLTTAARRIG